MENKYVKQLIDKYESQYLWDIRARSTHNKCLFIPVSEWLSVMNFLHSNDCLPAHRTNGECEVQGICTQDKKYFLCENTCRYKNSQKGTLYTFIEISEFVNNRDCIGYSKDYLLIRNMLDISKGYTFSNYHTYIAYDILKRYPNFNDITSYIDFISRYVGPNGADLCARKGVRQALNIVLNNTLKDEVDFKQLSWEVYSEVSFDELKNNLFYHDVSKKYTDKFTTIRLDGGLIY